MKVLFAANNIDNVFQLEEFTSIQGAMPKLYRFRFISSSVQNICTLDKYELENLRDAIDLEIGAKHEP